MNDEQDHRASSAKVAIVGAGAVGATFAYALMIAGLAGEIVLIDLNHEKAVGEAMDLSHARPFVPSVEVRAGDYSDCRGADIVAITAGAAQQPGESRLALAQRNVDAFHKIIPAILQYTRNAILLIVSNPVDILTYVAWKLSDLPAARVIGSGTVLDSTRFRHLLGTHCGVSPRSVHAYVIGEHGDSEVAAWSLTNIAGVSLDEYCPACERGCDVSTRKEIFDQVRSAAYEVIQRKGVTQYAVGLALTTIVESILRDENRVLTVSTVLDNYQGISDVALSVPMIVGREGAKRSVRIKLRAAELAGLQNSAQTLKAVLGSLKI
jgi:L-lactate dehydrogenase